MQASMYGLEAKGTLCLRFHAALAVVYWCSLLHDPSVRLHLQHLLARHIDSSYMRSC